MWGKQYRDVWRFHALYETPQNTWFSLSVLATEGVALLTCTENPHALQHSKPTVHMWSKPPISQFGTDLVLDFIQVVDSPQGEDLRGVVVPQLAENDAIPQCLLQVCGRR